MKKTNAYTVTPQAADSPSDAEINSFRGEFDFLSNFFEQPFTVDGVVYPTAEHAFQAMKTRETAQQYHVRDAPTPASAKARGRKVTLRDDWETARFAEMERVLRAKFEDPELRRRLLATGDRTLIEGNTWRDTTWGAVRTAEGVWKGRNELGKLLMRLRDELRAAGKPTPPEEATILDEAQRTKLIGTALATRQNAYVPYSHYKVGAAILTEQGQIVGGCNVENASYGLCNCAERTAVFTAAASGARQVRAVAVATEDGGTPCGACRQVLMEFAPRDDTPVPVLLLDKDGKVVRETTLAELLPLAFVLR